MATAHKHKQGKNKYKNIMPPTGNYIANYIQGHETESVGPGIQNNTAKVSGARTVKQIQTESVGPGIQNTATVSGARTVNRTTASTAIREAVSARGDKR